MPTVPIVSTETLQTYGDRGVVVVWNLGDADDGARFESPGWADRSIAFTGAFGGATVVLEGSNDGTNYFTLTDPQGNAITTLVALLEAISENTRFIRPRSSGGVASAIVATLFARRNGP